jgi:hypothetical protein
MGRWARTSCLVVEDPAEMLAVGKYIGLVRQVCAAGVDEVDARQPWISGSVSDRRDGYLEEEEEGGGA